MSRPKLRCLSLIPFSIGGDFNARSQVIIEIKPTYKVTGPKLAPKGLRKRWQKHSSSVPAIAVSRKLVTLGSNITLLLLTLVGVAWTVEGLGPGAWGGAGAEEDTGPTRVDPEDPLGVAEAAVEAA